MYAFPGLVHSFPLYILYSGGRVIKFTHPTPQVCREIVVPQTPICCLERNYILVIFALKFSVTEKC